MANEIKSKWAAKADFTITLASLGNAAGRQSTMLANASPSNARVKISAKITTNNGSNPTQYSTVDFYLLRGNAGSPTVVTDGAGASDAAITVANATPVGSILITTTNQSTAYQADFMVEDVGIYWGIAVVNRTGQALHSTAGNHVVTYEYMNPEVQ